MILNLKPIIILFSLLALAACANAQRMSKFITEFKGGLNLSEMDIANGNTGKELKVGFQLGGNFAIRMKGPLYLRTGLEFTKKGLKQHDQSESQHEITGSITKQDVKYTIDANYIQIPALLGLEFKLSKLTSINFYGGGYGGYGFKGKTKTKGQEIIDYGTANPIYVNKSKDEVDTFDSSLLKKWDYGLTASVGFVYEILSFSVAYEYGLYNISNDKSKELKNRNTAVTVAVRF